PLRDRPRAADSSSALRERARRSAWDRRPERVLTCMYVCYRPGMTVPAVVQIPIPQVALERSALARVDYTDAFVVRTGGVGDRTAEQWARSVLEGAPEAMRLSL